VPLLYRRRVSLIAAAVAVLSSLAAPPADARPRRGRAGPKPPPKPPAQAVAKKPAPRPPAPAARPKPAAYELLLTFDDGPRPDTTPKVLDTLDQFGIKAVFFVNGVRFMGKGAQAERARALLRETLKRGHIVGNHTVHHFFLCGKRGPTIAEKEILENAALIREATGTEPPLFRTPFGSRCPTLSATLGKLGIRPIGWDVDPQDWKLQDADKIYAFMTQDLRRTSKARSILLFHDVQPATADMLPRLLKWIVEESAVRQRRGEPPFKFVDGTYLVNGSHGEPPRPAPAVAATPTTPPVTPTAPTTTPAPAAAPTPPAPPSAQPKGQ
jgi:peptidoglycan/xylan/chitin deacetylase (PgdA/CDA1 family)